MKNKKQNDKLNSQDPLSKSLIYISGRGINIDKCILKDHSRPTGLNSTSQDRFLQSFISPWVSFNGKKKKNQRKCLARLGSGEWERLRTQGAERVPCVRAGRAREDGACRKVLVTYIPVPTSGRREREKFPPRHTHPHHPAPTAAPQCTLCCPPRPGRRGAVRRVGGGEESHTESGFHSPALTGSLQSSDA